uniref:Venom protein family 2 protein 12 n=1 Tax=Platymeris rhadamanthus TaxID=1134088 RepID=A0A6B9L3P5_PLARH|nr:venom protein family 2 protein 12 [Platymeris rhadamanthus]
MMNKISLLLTWASLLVLVYSSVLTKQEIKELTNGPFITVNIEDETTDPSRSIKDSFLSAKRMCQCQDLVCGCCTRYTVMFVGVKGCINIKLIPNEKAFEVSIIAAKMTVFKKKIEAKDLEKICSKVPKFEDIEFCLINTLEENGSDGFTSCMSLDISYKQELMANINFHCLKYADNKLNFEDNTKTGKTAVLNMKVRSPLEFLAKLLKAMLKKLEE